MGEKKRIVVKIGSSSLTESSGRLALEKVALYSSWIAAAWSAGYEVVLVTSGAIAAGFERLGFSERPATMVAKQACAAVGQGLLIQAYTAAFARHGLSVAQVLLTRRDFTLRRSYNNALSTLSLLLEKGAVPIINENDTVAVEEIAFGDNDILGALVGALIHADTLIILTDIDGLYDSNPAENAAAKPIRRVSKITQELLESAGGAGSKVGTGGMAAKLRAAQVALSLGLSVFVGRAAAEQTDSIAQILAGAGAGTYFEAQRDSPLGRKKQWIAFHSEIGGQVVVDAGAQAALVGGGKSLLPAGVAGVRGQFNANAVVEVVGLDGESLGKGVSNYSSEQLEGVRGLIAAEAQLRAGAQRAEVIHRDDWVAYKELAGE